MVTIVTISLPLFPAPDTQSLTLLLLGGEQLKLPFCPIPSRLVPLRFTFPPYTHEVSWKMVLPDKNSSVAMLMRRENRLGSLSSTIELIHTTHMLIVSEDTCLNAF